MSDQGRLPPDQWQRVKEVFSAALERAPAEQAAFLDTACGTGEAAIRREVEALLAAHQGSTGFLETPAADLASTPRPGEEHKTCSICQTPLPIESRFCLSCGADLSDPASTARHRASLKELFENLRVALERRYRVIEMVGRGGMGAVFLAEDLRLGRRVAIKVLLPDVADDHAFLKRFEREARIAAGLDHPNIVPIYSVEQDGDFHYFVMKYVVGQTLEALLADGTLPPESARRILSQAAAGLGHAHGRGVIHRDVKPSNLMLDEAGNVLIADFGISKALEGGTQYTSTGQTVGTPSYFSPEQAQGLPLDGRSDQYSLAVVGYRMLVGQLPLVAENVHALIYDLIHVTPRPAAEAQPEIPADLSEALQRALAKDPAERFESMDEFAVAVCRGGLVASVWPSPVAPTTRRRRRVVWAMAIAAVLATAAVLTLWQDRRFLTPEVADPTASRTAPDSIRHTVPTITSGPAAGLSPSPNPTGRTETPAPVAADTSTASATKTSRPSKRAPAPGPRSARTPQPQRGPANPSARPVGYLTVNAVPYGTVSIDGVELGDTPIVSHDLAPGDHVVRITREGYRAQSVTVTITAGNEVRLSQTLLREP